MKLRKKVEYTFELQGFIDFSQDVLAAKNKRRTTMLYIVGVASIAMGCFQIYSYINLPAAQRTIIDLLLFVFLILLGIGCLCNQLINKKRLPRFAQKTYDDAGYAQYHFLVEFYETYFRYRYKDIDDTVNYTAISKIFEKGAYSAIATPNGAMLLFNSKDITANELKELTKLPPEETLVTEQEEQFFKESIYGEVPQDLLEARKQAQQAKDLADEPQEQKEE